MTKRGQNQVRLIGECVILVNHYYQCVRYPTQRENDVYHEQCARKSDRLPVVVRGSDLRYSFGASLDSDEYI